MPGDTVRDLSNVWRPEAKVKEGGKGRLRWMDGRARTKHFLRFLHRRISGGPAGQLTNSRTDGRTRPLALVIIVHYAVNFGSG